MAGPGDEVLIPVPTYPLYTAVLAKIGARAVFYRTDPARAGSRTSITSAAWSRPATRALVVIDPNNPTGATYPIEARRALVDLAEEHNFPLLADEVYADLAFDGPVGALAALNPEAPVITFSSLSKAYLAPGMARRLDGGRGDDAARRSAGGDQEAGGRTAVQHRTDGARDRRRAQRRSVAPAGVPRRAPRTGGDHPRRG